MIKTRIEMPSGDYILADLKEDIKITDHFTVRELANVSANDDVKFLITQKTLQFMNRIEEFRIWYDLPMKVNSNYRTAAYNAAAGGIKTSEHLKGLALDWGITGHTDKQVENVKNRVFKQARSYGTGCHLIVYTWGYHIDFEGSTIMCIDRRPKR